MTTASDERFEKPILGRLASRPLRPVLYRDSGELTAGEGTCWLGSPRQLPQLGTDQLSKDRTKVRRKRIDNRFSAVALAP